MCWVLRRYQTGLYHWIKLIEFADQDLVKALVDLPWVYCIVFDVMYPNGMLGVMSFNKEICLEFVLQNTPKGV